MVDSQMIESFIKNSQSSILKIRLDAIRALGESGEPDALEPLVACLDSDWVTHEAAAVALGKLRDPRAVPALLSVLRSDERQGGSEVARALGNIGVPALLPLLETLKSTNDHVMRRAITYALLYIGAPAVEALIELLPVNGPVAEISIRALGWINDPRAVDPLLAILNTSDEKLAIIDALGDIGDSRAIDPLIGLLNESGQYFRKEIIRALYFIGDPRVLPDLKQIAKGFQNKTGAEDIKYWFDLAIKKFEQQEKSNR
jgi:HEAT repeat protein